MAVAAATFGAAFGYNVPTPGEFRSADAHHVRRLRRAAAGDLAAAERYFGTIDVITTRAVPVPGGQALFDLRGQDPDGPFGAPMLACARAATRAADEVAVTDDAAAAFASASAAPSRSTAVSYGRGHLENPGD